MAEDLKNKISEDFGLSYLSESEQERMIEKLGAMLFEAVIDRSVNLMDEDTAIKFEELLSSNGEDYDKILAFLDQNVSLYKSIVSEEMARIRNSVGTLFK